LADSPVSVRVHFNWPMPIVVPTCRLIISLNRGRVSRDGDMGGGVTSHSSSSSFSEDSGSEGVSSNPPPPMSSPPSGQHSMPAFSVFVSVASCFGHGSLLTSPHPRASCRSTAHCEHTRDPAQGHERVERIKMCKLPRMNPNGRTLVLAALSLKGTGLTPGFRSAP
jgi:hypothetical protein